MSCSLCRSMLSSRGLRSALRFATTSLLLGIGAVTALPALAWSAPLQRGDVLVSGPSSLAEYSPSGQPQQTIPGAAIGCIDPLGQDLIAPGVGLFDSSGNPLRSNWANVPRAVCAVDGLGHVYVNGGPSGVAFREYDLHGNLRQDFNAAVCANCVATSGNLDVAPDECTIDYSVGWGNPSGTTFGNWIYRFNVCSNTQELPTVEGSSNFLRQLRVLPGGQILAAVETHGALLDPSGNVVLDYRFPILGTTTNTVAPDPDGTSFWMGFDPASFAIGRFDINTGELLTEWVPSEGSGGIDVYAPPLFGDANLERSLDCDFAGTAEAFRTSARFSGQLSHLHLWADSSSTASSAVVGVYSDRNGQPDALQAQETISDLQLGSWNYVDVPQISVTAGRHYWIAVLGPRGGGKIRFRDKGSGGAVSETSWQHNLTALPSNWRAGGIWRSSPISAYGS